jgi:hypothetical protein
LFELFELFILTFDSSISFGAMIATTGLVKKTSDQAKSYKIILAGVEVFCFQHHSKLLHT